MTEKLKLDVDQASELKAAFRRGGWTNTDIKKFSEGTMAQEVLGVIHGTAKIVPVAPPEFKTFKTIKLGTGHKTADDFRAALKDAGYLIGNLASDILILGRPALKVVEHETEVELMVASVEGLGFPNGATYARIYKRAKELGLELCPAEVGPQLRLQYLDQPKGEWLHIAMEPISDSDGSLSVFGVARDDDGRWLQGDSVSPGIRFSAGSCWIFVRPRFKTFKTIKLGTGLKTADDFGVAFKDAGCKVSNWVSDILGKSACRAASKETEVDLVVASVEELGLPDGVTRAEIYERAKELGLELCPAEVGPQLRLQYLDQPVGEWLLIAMKPILASDGDLTVFSVGHGGAGRWLNGHYGGPDCHWDADAEGRWVFVRRK
jgi:hypothetical protein